MAVDIKDKDRNLRAELAEFREFKRNAPAKIARLPAFKSLIPNGGFDAGTSGWAPAASYGSTISAISGEMKIQPNVNFGSAAFKLATKHGRKYQIQGQKRTSGSGTVFSALASSASGSEATRVVSDFHTNATLTPFSIDFYGEISPRYLVIGQHGGNMNAVFADNISMWEVDPSDNLPWLRLPYGHRVGTQGHINRDGLPLMASDYEELFRGDQAFIKPLVVPGVNTEFDVYCGIGA